MLYWYSMPKVVEQFLFGYVYLQNTTHPGILFLLFAVWVIVTMHKNISFQHIYSTDAVVCHLAYMLPFNSYAERSQAEHFAVTLSFLYSIVRVVGGSCPPPKYFHCYFQCWALTVVILTAVNFTLWTENKHHSELKSHHNMNMKDRLATAMAAKV